MIDSSPPLRNLQLDASSDVEKASPACLQHITYWSFLFDKALITQEVLEWEYKGSGTEDDPYAVTWIERDPRNPMEMEVWKKWILTILLAFTTLAAAFISSVYSGCIPQIDRYFHVSDEVATLGLSLYILGFAVGPLLWAPLGEVYGRQPILFLTEGLLTIFNGGATASRNFQTLAVMRFFAGATGAASLTNAGTAIADMFSASERGFAISLFAMAPFMGPSLGPLVGGYLGEAAGWRWVLGAMTIFTGVLWNLVMLLVPETFAPLLLQKRAEKLSSMTGKVYVSKAQLMRGPYSVKVELKKALIRPCQVLIYEPIVLLLSVFMAIVYGTLYLFFGAFPIVYQELRGWSEGQGGLAFLSIALGMIVAVIYSIHDNNKFVAKSAEGKECPEDRLGPAMIAALVIPVSLIWFAWTNSPDIHWAASIAAGIPFGFGMVLVFISIKNYLVDAYTIFSASVLAATVLLRSIFGVIFPLFTTYMYHGLGIHWATMIPAFLSLACAPLPFLFYLYGAPIRKRCKFAAQAEEHLKHVLAQDRVRAEQTSEETKGESGGSD